MLPGGEGDGQEGACYPHPATSSCELRTGGVIFHRSPSTSAPVVDNGLIEWFDRIYSHRKKSRFCRLEEIQMVSDKRVIKETKYATGDVDHGITNRFPRSTIMIEDEITTFSPKRNVHDEAGLKIFAATFHVYRELDVRA